MLLLVLSCAVAAAAAPRQVVVNGKPVQAPVRDIGGALYVPVFPVARAMGSRASYNPRTEQVSIDGKPIPGKARVVDNEVYASAQAVASGTHATLKIDAQALRLSRAAVATRTVPHRTTSPGPAVAGPAPAPVVVPPPPPPQPALSPVPTGPLPQENLPYVMHMPTPPTSGGWNAPVVQPWNTNPGMDPGSDSGWQAPPPNVGSQPPPAPAQGYQSPAQSYQQFPTYGAPAMGRLPAVPGAGVPAAVTPDGPPTVSPPTAAPPAAVAPPPPPAPTPAHYAPVLPYSPRIAANGTFSLTVTNVETVSTYHSHYQPRAGYKFITVYVSEQNISGAAQVYTGRFSLSDNEGRSYEPQDGLSNFWPVVLKPQGINFGYLTFEIPQAAWPRRLVLTAPQVPLISVNL